MDSPEEVETKHQLHRFQIGDRVRDNCGLNRSGVIVRRFFTYEVEYPEGKRVLYQEERLEITESQ